MWNGGLWETQLTSLAPGGEDTSRDLRYVGKADDSPTEWICVSYGDCLGRDYATTGNLKRVGHEWLELETAIFELPDFKSRKCRKDGAGLSFGLVR